MVLIDTSIWIDHFRIADAVVRRLLAESLVLTHPWVIGELAIGTYRDRAAILDNLTRIESAPVATDAEVLRFIDDHALSGSGVGYIDVGLLASVKLTPRARLWTRDRRLALLAERLAVGAKLTH